MASRRKRILHIINGLDSGGAEVMLTNLVRHMDPTLYEHEVISLTTAGVLAGQLRERQVPVQAIGMSWWRLPYCLIQLVWLVRRAKPDLIQTWMYHSNALGGLVGRLVTNAPILWGIHATRLGPDGAKVSTYLLIRLCTFLSRRLPSSIICCSESAIAFHKAIGFDLARMTVVQNGFDLDVFRPNAERRKAIRDELNVASNALLIGMIARFHPNKDHRNYLLAAREIVAQRGDVQFVCIGKDVTDANPVLQKLLAETAVSDACILLGERQDVDQLLPAFDLIVLPSYVGEAFPMTLGEAMSCNVPCVATNVGDASTILGPTGRIVPIRDPEALATACLEVLADNATERDADHPTPRQQIAKHFRIEDIAEQYASLYQAVLVTRIRPANARF